jgi:hypothetical protein
LVVNQVIGLQNTARINEESQFRIEYFLCAEFPNDEFNLGKIVVIENIVFLEIFGAISTIIKISIIPDDDVTCFDEVLEKYKLGIVWTFDKPVGFAHLNKNRNSARLNRGNII